jgi:hypothetical protein
MHRIRVDERSNWRERAEQSGFVFHTVNGERYWDESAYYAFSLREIEDDLEAPTAALDAMCGELVDRAVADDRIMQRLAIPEPFWDFIATSWKHRDGTSTGDSTCAMMGRVRPRCSSTTPTRRLRCSKRRCSSGAGSMMPSRSRSLPTTPTSSTRCTSG